MYEGKRKPEPLTVCHEEPEGGRRMVTTMRVSHLFGSRLFGSSPYLVCLPSSFNLLLFVVSIQSRVFAYSLFLKVEVPHLLPFTWLLACIFVSHSTLVTT